jgi:hypothetical protein
MRGPTRGNDLGRNYQYGALVVRAYGNFCIIVIGSDYINVQPQLCVALDLLR